jgi:hypothetical protein
MDDAERRRAECQLNIQPLCRRCYMTQGRAAAATTATILEEVESASSRTNRATDIRSIRTIRSTEIGRDAGKPRRGASKT